MNIKGPQLLDKYVGETERQIREIFARARDRAALGIPVVIFFDEMEALFRTRGSGVSSDVETTVVPQLLAEIDGVEALNNVIVIGASNREDMIDPAILRAGRLDVKIRIERPNKADALDIMRKYLTPDLPIHAAEIGGGTREAAVSRIAENAVEQLFARSEENRFLNLRYENGYQETLYAADLVSGAMIAAIVDRAKKFAIKDFLKNGASGITSKQMNAAIAEEISQNEDIAQISNPDEWARVNGRLSSGRIVSVERIAHV
ncbi:AAA family ATPase [Arcanobacterium hippocoleae]